MARKAHGKNAARKARGREADDLRKHLSADALFTLVSGGFGGIAYYRPPDGSISLHDALMSAFAVFSLKDPLLLAFDQRGNDENLKALYHIENIPSDTHLRTILDALDPESLRPLFKDVFRQLQRGKALEPFVFYQGCYLLSLDGTGYFSSHKTHCASCMEKVSKNGEVTYYHQMLGAAIVHPDLKEVIPLMPEPIINTRTLAIDIDPAVKPDIVADSLKALPAKLSQLECVVITNPPYSHRHILQEENLGLYDTVVAAGYVDVYEYAVRRVIDQLGFPPTFAMVPENFIASRTTQLRRELCRHIVAIQIHSVSTCRDTQQPTILTYLHPQPVEATDLWLDDRYEDTIEVHPDGLRPKLTDRGNFVDFGFKEGQTDEQRDTSILLQSTDGGSEKNRIKLMPVQEKFGTMHYPGKSTDRAYVQVVPKVSLSERQSRLLIRAFNRWIDNWRTKTHGLGLTSFRSNTDSGFRRKRIDWKLARLVINRLILAIMEDGINSKVVA